MKIFQGLLIRALRNRGLDVISTFEEDKSGASDSSQLEYAAEKKRVIVTCNKKDFILLHREYLALNKKHFGIVLVNQEPIGVILKSFLKLTSEVSKEEMINRLEFLSNWG